MSKLQRGAAFRCSMEEEDLKPWLQHNDMRGNVFLMGMTTDVRCIEGNTKGQKKTRVVYLFSAWFSYPQNMGFLGTIISVARMTRV
jgi:hypothetical protein